MLVVRPVHVLKLRLVKMQEARPGFWVPDRTSWGWIFKGGPEALANLDRVEHSIEACGVRLRTAIDGGAFVGSWTLRLATSFKRVVAYEPIPENFDCLERNVTCQPSIAEKVDLCRCALTDRIGPMERVRPDRKAYGQQVRHVARPPSGGSVWAEMQGITIDSTGVEDVDLIKLDLEGHEYEALMGAQNTIAKYRPVIMIEEKHDPEKRATAFLKKLGMVCNWSRKYDFLYTWPVK